MASALFLSSWAVLMGPMVYGQSHLLRRLQLLNVSSIMACTSGAWLGLSSPSTIASFVLTRDLQHAT